VTTRAEVARLARERHRIAGVARRRICATRGALTIARECMALTPHISRK
jgi:hypothetical protein